MMMQTVARTPLHTRTFFKRSVPLVLQSEAAECGLACVAMIAKFYGDKRDLSAFRQNTSLSIRGTTLKDIMDIALHFGLQSRAVKIEMTDLNALTTPAILHWDMNHFVVLSKVTKSTITILDP
ncbi:MAG: cysteine peptidase family C39 domain-containing protein, partial [Pseudomonadota bacterium]|nr:cysteine peptidase family C39 domain-containing protein [Pseudomonadota bacterium]